ncbi:MAG: undecaprenyldiphospho-muramoylpentapeptide beta-N-acetylglucosaminyltransferase [Candidatus Omnitrophica bacterium]|nr:undecaprenyldiphospho-muramoylpentapeptide beta-N-acetylglucosaminyltransferase [Candidatus Omnitrophota bacterium]
MRVLIVAGGTGGHLFPAIRLAQELCGQGHAEVMFVTSQRGQDSDILRKKNIDFTTLCIVPLGSKNPVAILKFLAMLAAGTIKSLYLLLKFRPEVAIGFGGYVSGPIILLASLFRIKTVIHEQNVYPGKANRILARFVTKIALSFSETREYLKKFEPKIVVSGNPLRKELEGLWKEKKLFTILVMGGSQGAHALNKLIPEAIGLMDDSKKKEFEVIHLSGHRDRDDVERSYNNKGIKNRVFSFTEDMASLYSECDFVIARAGATTVSELLHLAKPAILVPYPHGNGHQRLNAKVLEERGGAVLIEEQGLEPEKLLDAVARLMDKDLLSEMAGKLKNDSARDAAGILMKTVLG